jgi:predicted nucleic acid-binding protein
MTAGTMLVVDASVAVKWFAREVLTEEARELLTSTDELVAPDWLLVEAASTFWKKVKKGEMLSIYAERHIDDLPLFFVRPYPARELAAEALRLAVNLKHSVYDCIYLALAERERLPLVTADVDLAAAARRSIAPVEVRLLA